MKELGAALAMGLACVAVLTVGGDGIAPSRPVLIPVHASATPGDYTAAAKVGDVRIRLLVLKHCFEAMADKDAQLAIRAADLAATKGLTIEDIGNFYIDADGQAQNPNLRFGEAMYGEKLKDFVSRQMKTSARAGDTLVIFTIGHGAPTGELQMMGQRAGVMRDLAEAAAENHQETVWLT